jgi:uncharacterized Ntn-hydrolase superfamily protein
MDCSAHCVSRLPSAAATLAALLLLAPGLATAAPHAAVPHGWAAVDTTPPTVETEDYGLYDLRVDHHAKPLTELRRLLAETEKAYYTSFRATVPTKANPHNY